MAKTFNIEIITPEKVVYADLVQSITAEGIEGTFGILADHAPFITELQTGILKIVDKDGKSFWFVLDRGFFEVMGNSVTVLTDMCVREDDVDVEKAMEERDRAEKALAAAVSSGEKQRAQDMLRRANVYLKLAGEE